MDAQPPAWAALPLRAQLQFLFHPGRPKTRSRPRHTPRPLANLPLPPLPPRRLRPTVTPHSCSFHRVFAAQNTLSTTTQPRKNLLVSPSPRLLVFGTLLAMLLPATAITIADTSQPATLALTLRRQSVLFARPDSRPKAQTATTLTSSVLFFGVIVHDARSNHSIYLLRYRRSARHDASRPNRSDRNYARPRSSDRSLY